MLSICKKTRLYLSYALCALLPLHAFFITWLRSELPESQILNVAAGWKEIAVILIIILIAGELTMAGKWYERLKKLKALDWAILAYMGLSLVWLPFQESFMQWAWGFRSDVLPFVLLLGARQATWEKSHLDLFIKIILSSALIVVIFGLLQATVLPQNFLTHFGYAPPGGGFEAGQAISSCQYLEHTPHLCRAISTFGGPTRFGTYLLVILGVMFGARAKEIRRFWLFLGAILTAIALTYSRSVWLGVLGIAIVSAVWLMRRKIKIIIIGLVALAVLIPLVLAQLSQENLHNVFRSIFVRGSSTGEHFAYMQRGIETIVQNPLGIGLGKVGPASFQFEKFLTENVFLQIGAEMGIIGLALFVMIIFLMLKELLARSDWLGRGLFISLVGLLITGFFAHSFEEPAAVITLMLLTGIRKD